MLLSFFLSKQDVSCFPYFVVFKRTKVISYLELTNLFFYFFLFKNNRYCFARARYSLFFIKSYVFRLKKHPLFTRNYQLLEHRTLALKIIYIFILTLVKVYAFFSVISRYSLRFFAIILHH